MPRNAGLEASIFGRKIIHFWRHANPSNIVYGEIDAIERAPLFLGSSRDDQNEQRSSTLFEIDRALADYGI